jgi:hypothetical protein
VSGGENMPPITCEHTPTLPLVQKVVFSRFHFISYPKITDGGIIHPSGVKAVSSGENMSPIYYTVQAIVNTH